MTWKDPEYLAFQTVFCGTDLIKIHKTETFLDKPE